MNHTIDAGHDDEFLAAACRGLRAAGPTALDTLGWWDLLPQLDDPSVRTAVFALFRAHGRELASTPALGALIAHPYTSMIGTSPGSVVAAVPRTSPRRGSVAVLVGDVGDRCVLIDRPGHGVSIVDQDRLALRPVDVPGQLTLHEVDLGDVPSEVALSESDARTARGRSTFLGRLALAAEVLGAAESTVELAVEHARNREQFGDPIGRFQAVRHLLAWARTDCVAIDAALRHAVRLDVEAPARTDEVVKALAGRNGRRACERSLQVLGGIGFTAEHDHHHFHSRVLVLDALAGTSAELTHLLGTWMRETGADPGFTAAALAVDGA